MLVVAHPIKDQHAGWLVGGDQFIIENKACQGGFSVNLKVNE
jgi:hypothetical protein